MSLTATEILDREFLEIRSRLLDLAAAFDRLACANGEISSDSRFIKLHEALKILDADQPDRAERMQLLFSRDYDPHWKDK